MTWKKAFKWTTPIWIVTIVGIGMSIFLTDFVGQVGVGEAIRRLVLVALVTLPLIAFLLKTTGDDVARFRATFLKQDAEGEER